MAHDDRHPRVIRSTGRMARDEIVNQTFPQAFRGVAEPAVRAFLRRIADEYDALRTRQDELITEIQRLEAQLTEVPPVEEQDLMSIVGDETARVLRSAKESAEDIRRGAEERAADLLRQAQEEARLLREHADHTAAERAREAEETAAEMLREADRLARELQEGAEARVAEFESEAEADVRAELESARRRAQEILGEAQATRDRVLSELARRREALETQIETLRVGRDRLVESYRVVKRTLEEATDALRDVDTRVAPEPRRPRVTSAALPADHSAEPEAPLAEPGPEAEPEPEPEPVEPPAPPRVGSVALGELDVPIPRGPTPAPPIERVKVDQPSGVRLLGGQPDPGAGAEVGDAADTREEPAIHAESHLAGDVEEIFARLRSQTEVAEEPEASAARAEQVPGAEPEAESAPPPDAESVATHGAPEGGGLPPAVRHRRDDTLEPLVTELARAVKRVVRDEQNLVLEAVRRHRGVPHADEVIPSAAEQDAAFAAAAADVLNEACAAGEALARELGAPGGLNGDGAARRARAQELASMLARELMDPLRGKLGDALRESAQSGGQFDVGERVRGRYREWKGQRLEGACRNVLAVAFSRGLYEAVLDGVALRWVTVDPSPCPDCADNVLEHTPKGQKFPTGHIAPPAHPGCHCLVVPADSPLSAVT